MENLLENSANYDNIRYELRALKTLKALPLTSGEPPTILHTTGGTTPLSRESWQLVGRDRDKNVNYYNGFLPNGDQIFIKEAPNDISEANNYFNEVIHEAFIGLYGLNHIPGHNFAKILSFNVGDSVDSTISSSNTSISSGNGSAVTVIYEYIDGPTLSQYMNNHHPSLKSMKSILASLFTALHEAYIHLKFTHYDLHDSNIIIRNYKTESPSVVIIDYGSAHITLHERKHGRLLKEGCVQNESMWYHDIVKILFNLLLYTNKKYSDIYKKYQLVSTLEEAIQRSVYYAELIEYKRTGTRTTGSTRIIDKDTATGTQMIDFNQMKRDALIYTEEQCRSMIEHYEIKIKRILAIMHNANGKFTNRDNITELLLKLLSFFIDENITPAFFREYLHTYNFFQPSASIIKKNNNFDNFLRFVQYEANF